MLMSYVYNYIFFLSTLSRISEMKKNNIEKAKNEAIKNKKEADFRVEQNHQKFSESLVKSTMFIFYIYNFNFYIIISFSLYILNIIYIYIVKEIKLLQFQRKMKVIILML